MQAVILAAGEGKRLRPLTNDVPKPMIDLNGRPIVEYIFHALPPIIDEVIFVVGYKGETIEDYFGDLYEGKNIKYIRNVLPHGTGYALLQAQPYLKDGCFLLLNGDDLYHPKDLRVCEEKKPLVFVIESKTPERFGVCLLTPSGDIERIIEKPDNPPSNLVNTGAYVLNSEIFDIPAPILPNGELNLAEQVGNWAQKRTVFAHKARLWNPINRIEELEEARNLDLEKIFFYSNTSI